MVISGTLWEREGNNWIDVPCTLENLYAVVRRRASFESETCKFTKCITFMIIITCVKLSVGPITHVESYSQVHKSWRTGSCLPFGNCKCYYLYFVKCLFLFLFVFSVVALVLSLFCPEGYPVWLTQQTTLAIREILLLCEIFRGCYLYNLNALEVIRLVSSLQLAVLYRHSLLWKSLMSTNSHWRMCRNIILNCNMLLFIIQWQATLKVITGIVFMFCRFSAVLLCVLFLISKTGILSFY